MLTGERGDIESPRSLALRGVCELCELPNEAKLLNEIKEFSFWLSMKKPIYSFEASLRMGWAARPLALTHSE